MLGLERRAVPSRRRTVRAVAPRCRLSPPAALLQFLMKPENRMPVAAALAALAGIVYLLDSEQSAHETTWQDFRVSYLEKGLVRTRCPKQAD